MSGKTAAIIGVTGMVGNYLLQELLHDPYFETIRLIVRRPYPKSGAKTEIKLVDFNDYESLKLAIDGSDVLFCTIGTTQKKVKGDKELYRKVDQEIPLKAARICKETGCGKFVIVSSVGANSKSNNFYLKLKGEVEDALALSGMESIHILQPSFLLGERKEKRTGERLGQIVFNGVSFLMIGPLKKYKPVHGKEVALAMLNAAKANTTGVAKYTYHEIKKSAQ
ncbi:MAG: NAD(P)H-binding protein [Bacteroidetes bacterium]|nr:NAD(P)H-binding protein [Bacteroidota bacterium]